MCYCFAVSDFLAGTVVINNVSECSCCEIACCCEYISSLPAGAAVKVQAPLITLKAMKGKKGKILPGNVFHVNPMNLDSMLSSGTQQCTWLEDGFVRYSFLCSNPFTLPLPLGKILISYRKELWPLLEWAGKDVITQLPVKGPALQVLDSPSMQADDVGGLYMAQQQLLSSRALKWQPWNVRQFTLPFRVRVSCRS